MKSESPDGMVLHRWIEPLGLCVMLVIALVLALILVRHHGRFEQWRLALAERRHPFAAPSRTLLAFGVAFACVIAFVRIAREVGEGETEHFDRTAALAVHSISSPALDQVMRAFSFVGSPIVVIPVSALAFVLAMKQREYRAGMVLVMVMAMSEILLVLLKDTFERARPTLFGNLVLPSYSFPSGHALAAAAIYGTLCIVFTRLFTAQRRIFEVCGPLLIAMIGVSRIYLGVHWPTDVLAGFAAGGFLVLAAAITLDGLPTMREASPAM